MEEKDKTLDLTVSLCETKLYDDSFQNGEIISDTSLNLNDIIVKDGKLYFYLGD